VEAPDREALLVAWLNHLLYLYDVDGFLGRDFDILELQDDRLSRPGPGRSLSTPSATWAKTRLRPPPITTWKSPGGTTAGRPR
jgi:hypothetical protein